MARTLRAVVRREGPAMNGRQYFAKWEREFKVAGVPPDVVQEAKPPTQVKRGPVESKLGGRITRDLKYLSPDDAVQRRELSEGFLKQPAESVPGEAEDDS
jgi:hypothetical protein